MFGLPGKNQEIIHDDLPVNFQENKSLSRGPDAGNRSTAVDCGT